MSLMVSILFCETSSADGCFGRFNAFFPLSCSVSDSRCLAASEEGNFQGQQASVFPFVYSGCPFALSSMLLFLSYKYIPAGLATTIVFLYPVLVAFIMVSLRFILRGRSGCLFS